MESYSSAFKRTILSIAHFHFRFAYIKSFPIRLDTDVEEGTVTMHWRILTLTQSRLFIKYIPKKLWRADNMSKEADVWLEGISTFWVDGNGMIYR